MSNSSLNIIFAGTPAFAATALNALLHSPHRVIAVYTQPDRQAGRGLKLTPSPVKELAVSAQLPVYQPTSLKDSSEQAQLASFNADVMVVTAYGMLLPSAVLAIPRFGCINIHPSLLPRWRGAAPIQRTIFAGDQTTGVTIMQMDEGLDTGPMLLKRECDVAPDDTTQTLHNKLAEIGASVLIEALDLLAQNKLHPTKQDSAHTTYANKITKEEALIDWAQGAQELEWKIRAFNPWPVAYTNWKNQPLRIWRAKAIPESTRAEPRTILHASHDYIDIVTGNGVLRLQQVQLPGGKIITAGDFYNAKREELTVGEKLI